MELWWEKIEGNLRWANTEPSMHFRRANSEPSMDFRKASMEPPMHFRRAKTEPSMDFRKANTEPSMYFRRANTETDLKQNVNLRKQDQNLTHRCAIKGLYQAQPKWELSDTILLKNY